MKKSLFILIVVVMLVTGCASPQTQTTLNHIVDGVAAGMNAFRYVGFRCESCHHNSADDRIGSQKDVEY